MVVAVLGAAGAGQQQPGGDEDDQPLPDSRPGEDRIDHGPDAQRPCDERDGHPPRIGAVTDQPDDWLSAIANGYGIALAPASSARFYARPGVTYRPVTGVSPSQVGVAWTPAADTDPIVQDFVRCCLDTSPQHDNRS
jgi:DNA-binding transcriptional LysR family regulator